MLLRDSIVASSFAAATWSFVEVCCIAAVIVQHGPASSAAASSVWRRLGHMIEQHVRLDHLDAIDSHAPRALTLHSTAANIALDSAAPRALPCAHAPFVTVLAFLASPAAIALFAGGSPLWLPAPRQRQPREVWMPERSRSAPLIRAPLVAIAGAVFAHALNGRLEFERCRRRLRPHMHGLRVGRRLALREHRARAPRECYHRLLPR